MPGGWELFIILAIALLLFGGSRLAGLGKGVGRSIREFKEEVKTVDDGHGNQVPVTEVVDAEIVQPQIRSEASYDSRPAAGGGATSIDADARQRDLEARERELAAREAELHRQREAGF